jgi:hypothetical protein
MLFKKIMQFCTYRLCGHMDTMSVGQILVIKNYEEKHYHHEKSSQLCKQNCL